MRQHPLMAAGGISKTGMFRARRGVETTATGEHEHGRSRTSVRQMAMMEDEEDEEEYSRRSKKGWAGRVIYTHPG